MSARNKVNLGIRETVEYRERLKAIAAAHDTTIQRLVERAIERFVYMQDPKGTAIHFAQELTPVEIERCRRFVDVTADGDPLAVAAIDALLALAAQARNPDSGARLLREIRQLLQKHKVNAEAGT